MPKSVKKNQLSFLKGSGRARRGILKLGGLFPSRDNRGNNRRLLRDKWGRGKIKGGQGGPETCGGEKVGKRTPMAFV